MPHPNIVSILTSIVLLYLLNGEIVKFPPITNPTSSVSPSKRNKTNETQPPSEKDKTHLDLSLITNDYAFISYANEIYLPDSTTIEFGT